MRVIDVLWNFNQKRKENMSPRVSSPIFKSSANRHQLPLELLERNDFVATLLEVFLAEENEERK